MLRRTLWTTLLTTLGCAAGCGGGGGSGGGGGGPPTAFDLYVDAVAGNDANPGTAAQPKKTITAALALAGAGGTVKVAPGTYDAANGEAFPLMVPPGVTVEGDVANRGDGPTPTLVTGFGPIDAGGIDQAALLPANAAVLKGLKIQAGTTAVSRFGVVLKNSAVELADCTLTDQVYVGVFASGGGDSDLHDNTFEGGSYGVWINSPTGAVKVRDSAFTGGSYALRLDIGHPCQITGNVFAGGSLQAVQLFSTNALVQGNTFTFGGHSDCAVWAYSGSPVLRSNTFTSNLGVRVSTDCTPDLGTAASAGLNSFAGVPGFGVKHDGTAVGVQARGNTWQHAPPTGGLDIVVTGAGSVVYGPGVNDKVP